MLTQEYLKKILHYNPDTGVFTRLVSVSVNTRKGDVAGTKGLHRYASIKIKNRSYAAHRLVWLYMHGRLPEHDIDHINHVKTDNRLCNLREATRAENGRNRAMSSQNTSGFKGVFMEKKTGMWTAACKMNGVLHCLGRFKRAEDASLAYQKFAKQHHGEFFHDTTS